MPVAGSRGANPADAGERTASSSPSSSSVASPPTTARVPPPASRLRRLRDDVDGEATDDVDEGRDRAARSSGGRRRR